MEEFIQEYRAEAQGILQRLIEHLLLLEKGSNSKPLIEQVFRDIHTLKGSSRMFGFDNIEQITHNLENIFDQLREGKIEVSKSLVVMSLQVMDIITSILDDNYDEQQFAKLLNQVTHFNPSQGESASPSTVYHILYYPRENVYDRGVNPLAVLNEMKELGEHVMFVLREPIPLAEQEANKKFLSAFEFIVPYSGHEEAIQDIFLFMDQEEFQITPLINDPQNWNDIVNQAERIAERKFNPEERGNRIALIQKHFTVTVKESVDPKIENTKQEISTHHQSIKPSDTMNFINVRLERLDEMMRLVSELVTIKAQLSYRVGLMDDKDLGNMIERLEKVTTRFRDNAFNMRLVPLQVLSLKFQRMVRDLGDQLGKEINLITEGLDTEIDKTIINEIEAPLMHIIRNSIDHGLESREERIKLGKTEKGLLKIVAFYSGANVFIQVQDDGRGLNLKRIREKAIQLGIVSESQQLSNNEIINLIFEPGFSTHDAATKYSGRGVGMDVVNQKIKELRGSIEITTEEGLGTAFTLRLPLSLAILDVLHVKVGEINYLIPHNEVEACLSERLNQDTIQKLDFNIKYKGKLVPFLDLGGMFNLHSGFVKDPAIIIINKNDQHVAVQVDEIVSKEQLVIKPVDEALKSLEYLSGISVLGSGELAFLINSLKLKDCYAYGTKAVNV